MKIKHIILQLMPLLAAMLLVACDQSNEKFKSYSVGFSTPNVKVWVSAAYLDQRIGILGGSIQGAWEEAGATNAVFNEPMPREIYVSWEEDESKLRYEATVKLVDDLAQRARKLPKVTYLPTNDKNVGTIDLIIGMATDGKVTVWLSNYPYSQQSITGRTLEVIGESQGKVTKQIPPYYPSRKAESPNKKE